MFFLGTAIFVDLVTVAVCCILLVRWGRLGFAHPATTYLIFHFTTFTVRSVGVFFGAPTLFSGWGIQYSPVTPYEIARASFTADIALVVVTLVWLKVAKGFEEKVTDLEGARYRELSIQHVWRVVTIAFPIGTIALALLTRIPVFGGGADFGTTSSWILILQLWPGLCLLALIYVYGFRPWLVALMSLYLLTMAVQGFDRFRVIIPVLVLVQIYLDRRNLRWPPAGVAGILIMTALLFYPLKSIGNLIGSGASPTSIASTTVQSLGQVFTGSHPDQEFEDEYASALTLIGENGRFYYGTIYAPLVTLPIPRQWWPDKPSIADYIGDFSRPWRPMKQTGMVVLFLGEAYANFGYVGIVLVPALLAYLLGLAYFAARQRPYMALGRFAYMLVAANLIQVWRDGTQSLVIFILVNMMPLVILIALHYVLPPESFRGGVPPHRPISVRSRSAGAYRVPSLKSPARLKRDNL